MISQAPHLLALLVLHTVHVHAQQCGVLTTPDTEGPYFVSGADLDYAIAPNNELSDRDKKVILWGQVRC